MSEEVSDATQEQLALEYSAVESDRFGYRIFRGSASDIDEKVISDALHKQAADIAIIRVPSEKQYQVARLDRTGFPYLVADTLVYYQTELTSYTPKSLKNQEMEFTECRSEDIRVLASLVREVFAAYTNHYHSNPLLDRRLMLGAFEDWAVRHVGGPGKAAWLARLDGKPVAFATCASADEECEGVLYGVSPSASGRGVYGDLIRFTQAYYKKQGKRQMTVSTQTQNYAVQVVWNREGFRLSKSLATIHINSMLSKSVVEKRTLDFKVTTDDIERCGRYSGDTNPLHGDDEFAKGIGFEGRIAHGLIVSAAISKHYGTEYPGPGAVFLDYSCKFMKPVYPDRDYRLTFSFPYIDFDRGIYRSLAVLTDRHGAPCLLAYSSLLRKT